MGEIYLNIADMGCRGTVNLCHNQTTCKTRGLIMTSFYRTKRTKSSLRNCITTRLCNDPHFHMHQERRCNQGRLSMRRSQIEITRSNITNSPHITNAVSPTHQRENTCNQMTGGHSGGGGDGGGDGGSRFSSSQCHLFMGMAGSGKAS